MPLNKGLLREFCFFLLIYGIDIGTDFAVYFEADQSDNRYGSLLQHENQVNVTESFLWCGKGPFVLKTVRKQVDHFKRVVAVFAFFLAVSCLVAISFMFAYLWMLLQTSRWPAYIIEKRDQYVKLKFWFGFAASMLQDVPLSCLAVELYAMRRGQLGLTCWECAQDPNCKEEEDLEMTLNITTAAIAASLASMLIVSCYKGVTTFYRWSKVENFSLWHIRGCASLFVGMYYSVIMLTPALGVMKYRFEALSAVTGNISAELTESLLLIGGLGWVIFAVFMFCCPLLRMIRISQ